MVDRSGHVRRAWLLAAVGVGAAGVEHPDLVGVDLFDGRQRPPGQQLPAAPRPGGLPGCCRLLVLPSQPLLLKPLLPGVLGRSELLGSALLRPRAAQVAHAVSRATTTARAGGTNQCRTTHRHAWPGWSTSQPAHSAAVTTTSSPTRATATRTKAARRRTFTRQPGKRRLGCSRAMRRILSLRP